MSLTRAEFESGIKAWLYGNSSGTDLDNARESLSETTSTARLEDEASIDDVLFARREQQAKLWSYRSEPILGHAYLERTAKVVSLSHPSNPTSTSFEPPADKPIEEDDEAALPAESLSGDMLHGYVTLQVVYSPSYQVPVLYFRGCDQAGTPLSLSSLTLSTLFLSHQYLFLANTLQPTSTDEKQPELAHFPAISQGENPTTGRPEFFLHPCETSTTVQDIIEHISRSANEGDTPVSPLEMIEAWMMLVGTIVDLS